MLFFPLSYCDEGEGETMVKMGTFTETSVAVTHC